MDEQDFGSQNIEFVSDLQIALLNSLAGFLRTLKEPKRSYQLKVPILILNGSVCPDSHSKSNLILIHMGGSEPVQWFSNDTTISLEL